MNSIVDLILVRRTTLLAFAIAISISPMAWSQTGAIKGFAASNMASERAAESQFLGNVSSEQVSEFHRHLTAEPHRAASPRNNELADYLANEWREQDWEKVTLRKYDALLSTPKEISLEMVAPTHRRASLREDPYEVDPQTKNPDVPGAYNAYSASGDVTADVVYAYGGNPEDYELLRQNGISVNGKIALVRYSQPYSFRGFKVLTAQREGAAAILIYSDPAEDGFARGKTFPDGPWGPESHIQRGLVSYASIVPGDPTTPGWTSVVGTKQKHLPLKDCKTLPKIMALAISWHDAKPLLENMTGKEVPKEWKGALPITYRFTGGVKAHLKVKMEMPFRTYTDVEARIEGSEHPEQLILLGNHRDAWVYGGADPSSGTASLLELSRALGELKKSGWRPKRTIVICSWDGEEEGLIGSTEWAEQYADNLNKNLVAYINVDTSIFGVLNIATGQPGPHFEVESVPSLAPMIVELSHDVRTPDGETLYDAWRKTRVLELPKPELLSDATMVSTAIDASSDNTSFLLHLCRPIIGLTYLGQYGVYHSACDDRYYMEHFGDPGFKYCATVSQFWGALAMRLANADVLPFDFVPYADTIHESVEELAKSEAAKDHVEFDPLKKRSQGFRDAAAQLNDRIAKLIEVTPLNSGKIDKLNRQLMAVESNWSVDAGIPGRPWSKHLIYGMRLTFLPLMLPGLAEAVEHKDWAAAKKQSALIEAALDRNTKLLKAASLELEQTK